MGPMLERNKNTQSCSNLNTSYAATTVRGWGQPRGNYYNCATLDQNMFFAIYDGYNQPQMANYTKMNFLDIFQNHSAFKKSNYKKALFNSILVMDELLASEKAQDFYKSEGIEQCHPTQGLSIHVLFIHEKMLYLANLGAIKTLACINGEATQLNPVHNFDDESELKRVITAGGEVKNNAIDEFIKQTRALGMHTYKANQNLQREEQIISGVPEMQQYSLLDVEFLLSGSAGLFDRLSDQEIVDFVRNEVREQNDEQQLRIAVENLVDYVIPDEFDHFGELKSMSNISVILIYFNK